MVDANQSMILVGNGNRSTTIDPRFQSIFDDYRWMAFDWTHRPIDHNRLDKKKKKKIVCFFFSFRCNEHVCHRRTSNGNDHRWVYFVLFDYLTIIFFSRLNNVEWQWSPVSLFCFFNYLITIYSSRLNNRDGTFKLSWIQLSTFQLWVKLKVEFNSKST